MAEPRPGVDGGVDLSDAYYALRARAVRLRRRRLVGWVMAGAVLAGLIAVVGVYSVSTIPLPDALSLPATSTVYYSDATTVMGRLGSQNRVLVDLATLPDHVGSAVIAAEDPGFWDDKGTRISRQYARIATGLDSTSPVGKARRLVMAWRLEDSFSKEKILEFYLNTVYFGRGAYGIEAAAQAYFGTSAAQLSVAQAAVLAGIIRSPGDGRYDPSVNPSAARQRFATVAAGLVALGTIDQADAQAMTLPPVRSYDPTELASGLDQPTGLVVAHALAELRATAALRGKPTGYLENGGFTIVTTVDVRAQRVLERIADETVAGSLMAGQPDNLQAAAVVVEPGTGRVLAYYGGHDGTGADYAGWYYDASGVAVGYGAHPPGQTFDLYTLAAALDRGISVKSWWDAPPSREFPASGRTADNPVRETTTVACQPTCTLADATTASLNVPYFALTERLGAAAVIDMATAAGVGSMWVPEGPQIRRQRVELRGIDGTAVPGSAVSPPFGAEVGLGRYPVTVLDQANGAATFAAGGHRAPAHFVSYVTKPSAAHRPSTITNPSADASGVGEGEIIYRERLPAAPAEPILGPAEINDLTWVLSQSPAGWLADDRVTANKTGAWPLRTSVVETAHAWIVGYTPSLAMAVWVGNEETELPLKDQHGARVTGSGLPAEIYRAFLTAAEPELGLPVREFGPPAFTGDDTVGNAAPPSPSPPA